MHAAFVGAFALSLLIGRTLAEAGSRGWRGKKTERNRLHALRLAWNLGANLYRGLLVAIVKRYTDYRRRFGDGLSRT